MSQADAITFSGSTGHHNAPRLVKVEASDPDNGDNLFSSGDVMTLTFDVPTYIGYVGSRGDPDPYRPDASQVWQGGRVAGWQGGRVAGWQGGWAAGWLGSRAAGATPTRTVRTRRSPSC